MLPKNLDNKKKLLKIKDHDDENKRIKSWKLKLRKLFPKVKKKDECNRRETMTKKRDSGNVKFKQLESMEREIKKIKEENHQ